MKERGKESRDGLQKLDLIYESKTSHFVHSGELTCWRIRLIDCGCRPPYTVGVSKVTEYGYY
jgi:hypothetical protein